MESINPVEILKKEHQDIERELIELETIITSETINYPNLSHVFKKIQEMWDEHETKEKKIFPILKREGIKIPITTIFFEHKVLRGHKKVLRDAIDSGSEIKIKEALESHGKKILDELRTHKDREDEILYTFSFAELSSQGVKDLMSCLEK